MVNSSLNDIIGRFELEIRKITYFINNKYNDYKFDSKNSDVMNLQKERQQINF